MHASMVACMHIYTANDDESAVPVRRNMDVIIPPHPTRATRPQVSDFFALGAQVSEISGAQVSAWPCP